MLVKNEERISLISAVGANGEGIVKEEGSVIFLPFAFLGEKVRYKILQVKKNIAFGKVLEVLTPAKERVKPVCPLFTKCGGCKLQHLRYSEQLKLKQNIVADCFRKIGNLEAKVNGTVPAEKEYGYRNKLQIPVVWQNGETVIGFYAENSHRAVKTAECAIHPDWAKKVIEAFDAYIKKTAVARSPLPQQDVLISELKSRFGRFSLYENRNDRRTNVVLGEEFNLLYGEGKYQVKYNNIVYEFGAESFLQVNTEMSRKLYKKTVELAAPDEDGAVVDAFSGAGLLTSMLAMRAKKAYGVEIVKEAVQCADDLARRNNLTDKMENLCGKFAQSGEDGGMRHSSRLGKKGD